MRYGHTILLIGISLALVAWIGVTATRVVDFFSLHDRDTTLVDLRVEAGHHELFRLSFTMVGAPHR
jgi:hypothetical protein